MELVLNALKILYSIHKLGFAATYVLNIKFGMVKDVFALMDTTSLIKNAASVDKVFHITLYQEVVHLLASKDRLGILHQSLANVFKVIKELMECAVFVPAVIFTIIL